MSDALVACIVPTYNGEAYVGEALASIAAQTYRPLEIIVADDGSTDRTLRIASEYAARVVVQPRSTTAMPASWSSRARSTA